MIEKYFTIFLIVLILHSRIFATSSQYVLAWPGMLPDHPLYIVKVVRDAIVLKLIKSPIKRVELYLQHADKGIYAAALLHDKGEEELAQKTALKAENYYTMIVNDAKWMASSNQPIPPILDDRIRRAAIKHQEVLSDLIAQANDPAKSTYKTVLYFSTHNYQEYLASGQRSTK